MYSITKNDTQYTNTNDIIIIPIITQYLPLLSVAFILKDSNPTIKTSIVGITVTTVPHQ